MIERQIKKRLVASHSPLKLRKTLKKKIVPLSTAITERLFAKKKVMLKVVVCLISRFSHGVLKKFMSSCREVKEQIEDYIRASGKPF